MRNFRYQRYSQILALILAGSIWFSTSVCAGPIKFEHFSTLDGLSQNSVTSIIQDSIGFLWFGTYDGLNRFDGYTFKKFYYDKYDSTSINHEHIKDLYIDKQGILWVGTWGGGISVFNSDIEKFVSFQHNPADPSSLGNDQIFDFHEDAKGNLWIATWDGGLSFLSADERLKIFTGQSIIFKNYTFSRADKSSIPSNRIRSFFLQSDTCMWLATRSGLVFYNPLDAHPEFHTFSHNESDPYSIGSNNVSGVIGADGDNLWISTWGDGIDYFERATGKFYHHKQDETNPNSLSSDIVMTMQRDRKQRLWICTWGGGISILETEGISPKNTLSFENYIDNENNVTSLKSNSVYTFFQDNSGMIWLGTDWGGIHKYDPDKEKIRHYTSEPNMENTLSRHVVFSMLLEDSLLWIGTKDGGINILNFNTGRYTYFMNDPLDPTSISNNSVREIIRSRSGDYWIGTEWGLNKFDPRTNRFRRYFYDESLQIETHILCMVEDAKGKLWIGNYGSGMSYFDPVTWNHKNYVYESGNNNSLSNNVVWDIEIDDEGNLLIATDNGGLNVFNPDTETFLYFKNIHNDTNSLNSDNIHFIFRSSTGDYWIGTSNGLSKMIVNGNDYSNVRFVTYTTDDGLPSNSIVDMVEDQDGNFWVTTNNGLSKFIPGTLSFKNYYASNGLQDNEFSQNALIIDPETGVLYAGGINGFSVFHPDDIADNTVKPAVVLTELKIQNTTIEIGDTINGHIILPVALNSIKEIIFSFEDNVIEFEYAGLHFKNPANNKYAYYLENFESDWKYVNTDRNITYTNLDPGKYTLKVKACNSDGVWNEEGLSLSIIINPPWWQTIWFRSIAILTIFIILVSFYYIRMYRLINQKAILKAKVRERTAMVREKNMILEKQAVDLNDINTQLEERQQRVEEQAEELRAQAEELHYTNKSLMASNATKDKFFSIIAHDLKNPFSTILGFCEVLKLRYDKYDDAKRKHLISAIDQSATNLYRLLENLLQWSRSQTGNISYNPIEYSLDQSIGNVVTLAKNQVNEKGLQLEVIMPEKLQIYADKNMIETVIRNLVTNAVKFTHSGKVIIKAEELADKVKVSVIDSGVGIAADQLENIFEISRSKSTEGTKGEPGTGLGLIICKDFIEKNFGEIGATSQVGIGSTFHFIVRKQKRI